MQCCQALNSGAYAEGVHWMHVHPHPTQKKFRSEMFKRRKKFLPDMLAKRIHVLLRYDKIKTKKVKKKEEKSKRKGIKERKKERKKDRMKERREERERER